jgi:hypothetical protein
MGPGKAGRTTLGILAAGLLGALAWGGISRGLVAPLVARAYRGESLPALSRLLRERDVHPLAYYLAKWDEASRAVLWAWLAAILVLLVAARPEVQRLVDARLGERAAARSRTRPARSGGRGFAPCTPSSRRSSEARSRRARFSATSGLSRPTPCSRRSSRRACGSPRSSA